MAPLTANHLTILCANGTLVVLEQSNKDVDGLYSTSAVNTTTASSKGLPEKDRQAILYIAVVLLFYSTGIIIGIITYLKREKAEIEEDKRCEDYMNFRSQPDKWAQDFRVKRMTDKLRHLEASRQAQDSLSRNGSRKVS